MGLSCSENKTEIRYIDGNDVVPPKPPWWEVLTLYGVDSDNDGVRDDIELWINGIFEDENYRFVLKRMAAHEVGMLKAYPEIDKVNESFLASHYGARCLIFLDRITGNYNKYPDILGDLYRRVKNTSLRAYYYTTANREVMNKYRHELGGRGWLSDYYKNCSLIKLKDFHELMKKYRKKIDNDKEMSKHYKDREYEEINIVIDLFEREYGIQQGK